MDVQSNRAARTSKKYAHAPITEAIIEIRVLPRDEVTAKSCESVFANVKDFSVVQELFHVKAQILGNRGGIGAQAAQDHVGYRLEDKANSQVIAIQRDRFAFSQLAPYDCWDAFESQAKKLWEIYKAGTDPMSIVRVATRFINKIEIPVPVGNLNDCFRTVPTISPDMQQDLAGCLMQLQLPQVDLGCGATLNFAILGDVPDGSAVAFLIDVDVFDDHSSFSTDPEIWDRLGDFRWRKNDIFEASITDRVRDLIS